MDTSNCAEEGEIKEELAKEDGKEPISNIILQTSSVGGYDQASLVGHGMLWCHLVIKTGSEPKLLATMVIISS